MLKFAMGLLGGTTNKKGFAGFAEVLGKAGEQAVDSAIVLASKEKERRADLAAAFLKNKEGCEIDPKVLGNQYTLSVPDPSVAAVVTASVKPVVATSVTAGLNAFIPEVNISLIPGVTGCVKNEGKYCWPNAELVIPDPKLYPPYAPRAAPNILPAPLAPAFLALLYPW